ncbi:MAG TPA: ATP-binding protein [Micromonosporaceae bacterium]
MTSMASPDRAWQSEFNDRLANYRRTREQIERAVLPLATSIDGTTFECQASLHDLRLRRGGYVLLDVDGAPLLGQISDLRVDSVAAASEGLAGAGASVLVRLARGNGILLSGGTPFHDAPVRVARAAEVGGWLAGTRSTRAGLTIGELLLAPGVAATLDSGGLDRHTFLCGQSGSGKTYSLGVLLERILAGTRLRVVILDPNSDYVGLPELRAGADPALAAGYTPVLGDIAVWSNRAGAQRPLRLRFADLEPSLQAAVLGLDPIRDREEYAALVDLLRAQGRGQPVITGPDQLLTSDRPGARALGLRALNLGVFDWPVWSPHPPSLVDDLVAASARCTVVDLGSLDSVAQQRLVAAAVLSTLWRTRLSREACLIVVDEAHNVCPAEPPDEISGLSTDRAVRIAAEGRKYGRYLLTSTQRPHKVHEHVVSQCDNLVLMRMNSQADLADLSRLFSFVPPGLMAGATSFRLGQALIAGKILPQPAYVQMGQRVSQEGGADLPATWADPNQANEATTPTTRQPPGGQPAA